MNSFETWGSTLLPSIQLLATLAILNNWVLPAWRKDCFESLAQAMRTKRPGRAEVILPWRCTCLPATHVAT